MLGAIRGFVSRMDDHLAADWSPRLGMGIAMGAAVLLAGWWAMIPFAVLAVIRLRFLPDFIFWTAWVAILISPGYYRPSIGYAFFLVAYHVIGRLSRDAAVARRSKRKPRPG